ncbi:hypothetical protein [Microbacterium sp. XT11]|uniref:hypothetical protein n=1 Tax=Microbacterium sp. XT11 TaxID=367477 RepID=UPI0008373FF2|nr:hypothetical protein [Microbacterium sp. XT11]
MIGRALRAQARSFSGDVVLLGVAAAAFVLSLSLAASIPPELAEAPTDAREALTAPLSTVLATYAAVLSAVYGSFRYTIDRRDGVIAQRLTLQPRWTMLLARMPGSAAGGAIVALAVLVGGHVALIVAMGGIPVDWRAAAASLALGAVAGLWGFGVGVIVEAHLPALFLVSLSMGAAVVVVMFWEAGAVYLPLLAMLEAFRFDVAAVGVEPGHGLEAPLAMLVSAAWVVLALVAGSIAFLTRDVS